MILNCPNGSVGLFRYCKVMVKALQFLGEHEGTVEGHLYSRPLRQLLKWFSGVGSFSITIGHLGCPL